MPSPIIARYLPVLFIALMTGFSVPQTMAQECSEVTLNEARKSLELGRFREVIDLLQPCIDKGFNENLRVEAYRLTAVAYLAMDKPLLATDQVKKLLMISPNYEPNPLDFPMFIRLIRSVRSSGSEQLVTSVSKKAETLQQAPATIVVITREDILKRGYNDLVELLKDVPGFDLCMFYGPEYANVYQRGFRQNNTEKTLLLIDGIEENDLWTNWAYIDRQYPLSNIDRVEIIYGPASTMYGPNAFAGVINVISRTSVDAIRSPSGIGISGKVNYGTYNTRTLDLSLSGKKQFFSFTLSGRIYHSDEADLTSQSYFDYDPSYYDGVDYNKILGKTTNAKKYLTDNKLPYSHPYYQLSADSSQLTLTALGTETARNLDKSQYDMTVNGRKIGFSNETNSWLLNGNFTYKKFTLGFQTWHYKRGGTTQYTDTYVAGSDNNFIWSPQLSFLYAKYENEVNDRLSLSNVTSYKIHLVSDATCFVSVQNYARGNKTLVSLVNDAPPVWTSTYMYELSKQLRNESKIVFRPHTRLDLIAGVEVRNSTIQGAYYTSPYPNPQDSAILSPVPKGGNEFNIWDIGAYSQGTWQALQNMKITLGLRYDYNVIRTNGGFGSALSPRLVLVYSPGRFTVKAIYSRGIMNVSNWTKYSTAGNRIPNPNLATENIQNLEISGAFRLSKALQCDATLYYDFIDNVVGTMSVPDNPGKIMNANIGEFHIFGIQANASYKADNFGAWINYTYCNPRQTYSETGKVDNRVGDIASNQFNVGADYLFFNQLNLDLRMNFTGKRLTGSGTSVPANFDIFPAKAILNGTVTYSNSNIIKGLALQIVCNNIFNTLYYHPGTKAADGINSPTSILQRGRHFLINLTYDF